MPSRQWTLKRNDGEIARFEFQIISPIDSNKNPVVFVSAIRLRNNGNDVITGDPITDVEVKWYRWDKNSSQYVEITRDDLGLLDNLARDFESGILYFDSIDQDSSQLFY